MGNEESTMSTASASSVTIEEIVQQLVVEMTNLQKRTKSLEEKMKSVRSPLTGAAASASVSRHSLREEVQLGSIPIAIFNGWRIDYPPLSAFTELLNLSVDLERDYDMNNSTENARFIAAAKKRGIAVFLFHFPGNFATGITPKANAAFLTLRRNAPNVRIYLIGMRVGRNYVNVPNHALRRLGGNPDAEPFVLYYHKGEFLREIPTAIQQNYENLGNLLSQ